MKLNKTKYDKLYINNYTKQPNELKKTKPHAFLLHRKKKVLLRICWSWQSLFAVANSAAKNTCSNGNGLLGMHRDSILPALGIFDCCLEGF